MWQCGNDAFNLSLSISQIFAIKPTFFLPLLLITFFRVFLVLSDYVVVLNVIALLAEGVVCKLNHYACAQKKIWARTDYKNQQQQNNWAPA